MTVSCDVLGARNRMKGRRMSNQPVIYACGLLPLRSKDVFGLRCVRDAGTMTGPVCGLHGPDAVDPRDSRDLREASGNAWSHSWSEVGSSRVAVDP